MRDYRRDYDALVAAVPDEAVERYAVAGTPDEAVERYAVAGTPDEVRDRLGDLERHVDHLILGGAWYGVSAQRAAENLTAILETFAPGS